MRRKILEEQMMEDSDDAVPAVAAVDETGAPDDEVDDSRDDLLLLCEEEDEDGEDVIVGDPPAAAQSQRLPLRLHIPPLARPHSAGPPMTAPAMGPTTPAFLSENFRRKRTYSTSASISTDREPIIRTNRRTIYTAGRPPWYDSHGKMIDPFVIGICGGSASGKTTVAQKIITELDVPWVTLLSMDSFYKVLNEEQHEAAGRNEHNFDHRMFLRTQYLS
jgi:hypothetical protein